jgi:hypothetical protein
MTTPHAVPLCPSAQPDTPGARVFAVVGGTAAEPELSYLDEALPLTPELVALTAPVTPAEVFRIAGHCAQSTACLHWAEDSSRCRLALRTVRLAEVVVRKPPRCAIRSQCQWWAQEGVSGCLRCPQVLTHDAAQTEATRLAADPHNLAAAQ